MKNKTKAWLLVGAGLWVTVLTGVAFGYPKPALVTEAWGFEFSYETPALIVIRGDQGGDQWYWYMTYTVVNNTGEDRMFLPQLTVYTDNGQMLDADRGVGQGVFDAIKQEVNRPLLEDPVQVTGRLLQGVDQAKEGVAIWAAMSDDVDRISVFISGLSGETEVIEDHVTGEPVIMRRTLMIDYAIPGTAKAWREQPVVFEGERWIMR